MGMLPGVRRRIGLPPRADAGRRGAALLEMLVSISILMTAAVILAQYVVMGIDESAMAQRRAMGYLLAQERLEDLLAHRADLDAYLKAAEALYPPDPEIPAVSLRHFDPARKDFRWRWDVKDAPDLPGLKEVTVWVHWQQPQDRSFRPHCRLRTLLAVPSRQEAGP